MNVAQAQAQQVATLPRDAANEPQLPSVVIDLVSGDEGSEGDHDEAFLEVEEDYEPHLPLRDFDFEEPFDWMQSLQPRQPVAAPNNNAVAVPPAQPPAAPAIPPPAARNQIWGDYIIDDDFDVEAFQRVIDLEQDFPFQARPAPAPAVPPPPQTAPSGTPASLQQDQQPPVLESREECVQAVSIIFPGICLDHVVELYNKMPRSSEQLMAHILDQMDKGILYPKARDKARDLKRKRNMDEDEEAARKYGAPDRIVPANIGGTRPYIRNILQHEFPDSPMAFIDTCLGQSGHRLYSAYKLLDEARRYYQPGVTYTKLKAARKSTTDFRPENIETLINDGDFERAEILRELQAARKAMGKAEAKLRAEIAAKLEEEENERKAQAEGTMQECGCCFGDFPRNRMIHCDSDSIHWFCRGCALRNAETEVGQSKYELTCMSMDGCSASFSLSQRNHFLDEKTKIALERNEQEANLRLAGIENLASCPFCPFAAEYPSVEVDREFRCMAPDCEKVSCRLCKLESHIPKTCEENAKEAGLSIRRQVEEAMSAAMIRKCNKCGTPFIKEEGCNKMRCTLAGCGNTQCYVCSKSCDYAHFNDETRGGKTGNCPLFESAESRHSDEVNKAEKEALEKIRAEHPEYTDDDLKIKVSEAVQKDDEARRRRDPPRLVQNLGLPARYGDDEVMRLGRKFPPLERRERDKLVPDSNMTEEEAMLLRAAAPARRRAVNNPPEGGVIAGPANAKAAPRHHHRTRDMLEAMAAGERGENDFRDRALEFHREAVARMAAREAEELPRVIPRRTNEQWGGIGAPRKKRDEVMNLEVNEVILRAEFDEIMKKHTAMGINSAKGEVNEENENFDIAMQKERAKRWGKVDEMEMRRANKYHPPNQGQANPGLIDDDFLARLSLPRDPKNRQKLVGPPAVAAASMEDGDLPWHEPPAAPKKIYEDAMIQHYLEAQDEQQASQNAQEADARAAHRIAQMRAQHRVHRAGQLQLQRLQEEQRARLAREQAVRQAQVSRLEGFQREQREVLDRNLVAREQAARKQQLVEHEERAIQRNAEVIRLRREHENDVAATARRLEESRRQEAERRRNPPMPFDMRAPTRQAPLAPVTPPQQAWPSMNFNDEPEDSPSHYGEYVYDSDDEIEFFRPNIDEDDEDWLN